MELISKQAALDIINSYGGADATEPEDKLIDNLIRAIYADVDSIETEDIGHMEFPYAGKGTN